MKRYLLIAGLSLITLAGCGGGYRNDYYAYSAPPPPRYERYGPAPSPGHVWINGYWNNAGGRYGWTSGYWARPPHRNARWVDGRWDRDGRGFRYRKGYWR